MSGSTFVSGTWKLAGCAILVLSLRAVRADTVWIQSGTGNPIAIPQVKISGVQDDVLVMNGDVLTDIDYGGLLERHAASDAAATIATKARQIQVSLGVLRFGDEGDPTRLTGYDEKPAIEYASPTSSMLSANNSTPARTRSTSRPPPSGRCCMIEVDMSASSVTETSRCLISRRR